MKHYTKEEAINAIKGTVSVSWRDHGTWKVDGKLDGVKLSYLTHDEDDYTGIFDGETYNECAKGGLADGTLTKEEYDKFVADSACEDNYESRDDRDVRLAETLLDIADASWPDNLVISESGAIITLTDDEISIANSDTYLLNLLLDDKFDEFEKSVGSPECER